jgi:hypothetical protein
MTNTIVISGPKLLPPALRYHLIGGKTAEACLEEFRKGFPYYDPGTVFWHQQMHQLFIPMSFDAEAKVTEVTK